MAKKSNTVGIVLAVLVIALIFFGIKFLQGPTNGPDLNGDVVDGSCVSRSGADIVICCLKENADGVLESVPCEDTVVDTQALLSTGGLTYNVDAVCYSIKVSNTGNVPLDFDVISANTVASNGGDSAGAAEFDDSWDALVALPKIEDVPVGGYDNFAMKCTGEGANPIRLSAGGFMMANGRYTSTMDVQATSAESGATATQQKTLVMDIAQENLGFSIAVDMI